ncbi:myomegalin-like [Xyrauchen texanus]|uniref:myomegalin-like n=1 Tax=Xyrauchen texanus TaxID=154827 RepID=UPI002241D801|nr:myomegalin-like [Xyrauchen texanus]
MKEVCRICARELCGNQRRWIFHPASKLNLQVLLSHALRCDLQRDGRCEFVCSKCVFMLDRMYRFDTVIARVEALSIERLHRLLQEKERLRQCISALYRKNNPHAVSETSTSCTVDSSGLRDVQYCTLLQDNLMYCMYESWAEDEDQTLEFPHNPQCHASEASSSSWLHSRRCRGCSTLRVLDSDYEAVCKVPRKVVRSSSCGPSTRYSASSAGSLCGEEQTATSATLVPERQRTVSRSSDGDRTLRDHEISSASVESLEKTLDVSPSKLLKNDEVDGSSLDSEEHLGASSKLSLALSLLQNCVYKPVQSRRGSKLPVLIKCGFSNGGSKLDNPEQVLFDGVNCTLIEPEPPGVRLDLALELTQLEELWSDVHEEYLPFCLRKVSKKTLMSYTQIHLHKDQMTPLFCMCVCVFQSLVEEQQSQLQQYECAAAQCVSELQKAQLQVQTLQNKIHKSEASNQELQVKLCEMEVELRSIRQASQNQERTIQNLTDDLNTKHTETQELYHVIEDQNSTLRKLREMTHNQPQHIQAADGAVDSSLMSSQSSLLSYQLELEANRRAHRLIQRHMEDVTRSRDRLQDDLNDVLQQREDTHKHNQELCKALEQLRSELQVKVCELRDHETDSRTEITNRDKTISQLQQRLRHKDTLIQEYSELLEPPSDSTAPRERDALLDTLRSRIKDRDRALERSIDEKFYCLEEKDSEVRRLQLALREKERDLERLRCILNNNEETITSLDAVVCSKQLDLERTQEACRRLECLKQQSDDKHTHAVGERDDIINQLQTTIHTLNKETEELRSLLIGPVSSADVLQQLQSHLSLKERLFEEVMSERSRQTQEHHTQLNHLLDTISARDKYSQDYGERLGRVISERSGQLQELRRQLSSRERELNDVNREREREREKERELQKLQSLLKEKDNFIQLLQGQTDATLTSAPAGAALSVFTNSSGDLEVQAIRDELQLTLNKHRETERELSELRSALTAGCDGTSGTDQQCVLQQLVFEQQTLNEALRSEKKLYENIRHINSQTDGVEKTRALHAELDSVQVLREQLEDVLTRTRETALAHVDYGGGHGSVWPAHTNSEIDTNRSSACVCKSFRSLIVSVVLESSTDDDDDDDDDEEDQDSSEEFTDSIEDDDTKLTAQSLMNTLNVGMKRTVLSQNASAGDEVEQRMREMSEEKTSTGYCTHTHIRNTLPNTNEESAALNQNETGLESRGELESGLKSGLSADEKVPVRCRGLEESETDRLNCSETLRASHTLPREEEEERDDEDVRAPQVKRRSPPVKIREGELKRRCTRPHSLDLGALLSHKPAANHNTHNVQLEHEVERDDSGSSTGRGGGVIGFWQHVEAGLREQAEGLRSDLAMSRQESRELQERLMVSEATVHALNEQLKDYRELLTESAVQHDSKHVQVDLQDLGYETSGRSENEAERDDISSPEFEELQMCVSPSGNKRCGWHGDSDGTQMDDASSLQRLVQDLRGQLSRSHKVIRGLQLRIRSLSATSDYSSSLERTPRKVNWAFQASTSHGGLKEDEGWQSDRPLMPSTELQELVTRVALLETQIKNRQSDPEKNKCATWPRKYNTLIQAQARELSHLRQKMREGRGICHILTRHLSDTTKAFEELLRANDIDYYMSQSFREQLAQNISLAQRITDKISGREHPVQQDDKTDHELLRLSQELQQKDRIIESLHNKLQQRPDTPYSSHAPSETTDQSDINSFVSDERGSTNEDADLCSDMDAASEFTQEVAEPTPKDRGLFSVPKTQYLSGHSNTMTFDPMLCPGADPRMRNVPEKCPPRGHRPPMRTLSAPHSLSSYQLSAHTPRSFSYPPVSHHAPGHGRQTNTSLLDSTALWDMENMIQPISEFDGSSYYQVQSGNSQSGVDVIEEHLREIRSLRQHLEDSIRTNERLRQQLERRVVTAGREKVAPTNIFIQSHDTVSQLTNEIRALKEENLTLQSKLKSSRENSEEVEQLREVVLSGRVRLKQAELEAGQWKEELLRLQTHNCEQSQQIQQLRQDRQNSQEHNNRLQHEASLLQQQLSESRQLLHSLQCELQLYDRVCGGRKSAPAGYVCEVQYPSVELGALLLEVRALKSQLERSVQENGALRLQLQKQLELFGGQRPSPLIPASPLRDVLYRRQLLHDPSPSPPVRDVGPFSAGPPYSPYSELEENTLNANDSLEPHADLEGEAPDGSFAHRNGRHVIGHVDDYSALQQQVLEGRGLLQHMEAALQSCLNSALLDVSAGNARKCLDYSTVKTLLSDTNTLRQILEEAISLLKMFWRAALPSSDGPAHLIQREQSMREEIQTLRLRITEQEEVLQGTIQRLRSSNRTKENMETFIVNQLSRTRDVLRKARVNLEKNELRISSLSSSSSSLCHGKVLKGVSAGSSDWGHVTPACADITMETVGLQSNKKQGRECLKPTVCH